MTPSEIANRLEAEGLYQSAATIRAQAEALKIATEALERICEADDGYPRIARRALARIEGAGQ